MKPSAFLLPLLLGLAAPLLAQPTCTIEVDVNDPGADYQDIQSAVDAASDGDVICVQPGTYLLSQELLITKSITVRAVRGPEVTILRPATIPPTGQNGVRFAKADPSDPAPVFAFIGFQIREFYRGVSLEASGTDALFANNIVTRNEEGGFAFNRSNSGVSVFTQILNNTFAYNPAYQITYYGSTSGNWPEQRSYNNLYINVSGCPGGLGTYSWGAVGTGGSCSGNPQVSEALAFRFTSTTSPLINAGHPNTLFNDPDGTRGDIGAYGGPYSQGFFRDVTGGPTITEVAVSPAQVAPGDPIVIRATVRTD